MNYKQLELWGYGMFLNDSCHGVVWTVGTTWLSLEMLLEMMASWLSCEQFLAVWQLKTMDCYLLCEWCTQWHSSLNIKNIFTEVGGSTALYWPVICAIDWHWSYLSALTCTDMHTVDRGASTCNITLVLKYLLRDPISPAIIATMLSANYGTHFYPTFGEPQRAVTTSCIL